MRPYSRSETFSPYFPFVETLPSLVTTEVIELQGFRDEKINIHPIR